MADIKWDKQLVEDCEKVIFALDKGRTIGGGFVTEIYNRIYNQTLKPTNCHACIVDRSKKIKKAYDEMMATIKNDLVDTLAEIASESDEKTEEVQVTAQGVKTPQRGRKRAKKGS